MLQIREESGEAIDKGPYYSPDPIGERTGNACSPDTAEVIMKTIADAKASVSKDLVARKVATTMAMLQEKIDNIRGAVMIGGWGARSRRPLPPWRSCVALQPTPWACRSLMWCAPWLRTGRSWWGRRRWTTWTPTR